MVYRFSTIKLLPRESVKTDHPFKALLNKTIPVKHDNTSEMFAKRPLYRHLTGREINRELVLPGSYGWGEHRIRHTAQGYDDGRKQI